ncbi:MAG: hypothetical protein MPW14_19950 [Candidatus Manganitrophus sp.]|nr:MAG: hypothetical protein MPW14_19950 [Candidatus Manganitrophus sp.]
MRSTSRTSAALVVLGDLTAGPVEALDEEIVTGLDLGHHGNVRVPAVVDHFALCSSGALQKSTLINVSGISPPFMSL